MRSAQFSLRQTLVAMLACAIIFAIAAPFLRRFSLAAQASMCAALGVALLGFGAGVLRMAQPAAKGGIVGRKNPPAGRPDTAPRLVVSHGWNGADGCRRVGLVAASRRIRHRFLPVATFALAGFSGWTVGHYSCQAVSHKLALCERGVIIGGDGFVGWHDVRYFSWGNWRDQQTLRLALRNHLLYWRPAWRTRNSRAIAHRKYCAGPERRRSHSASPPATWPAVT